MNEYKILSNLIFGEYNYFEVINKLNKIEHFIFTSKSTKEFYELISTFINKYGNKPNLDYLETLFSMDNKYEKAKEIFDNVIDEYNEQDNLFAIIEQQLNYNLKTKFISLIEEAKIDLQQTPLFEIENQIKEVFSELSDLLSVSNTDTIDEIYMNSEVSINEEINEIKSDVNTFRLSDFDIPELDDYLDIKKGDMMMGILAPPKSFKSTFTRFVTYKQILQGVNTLFLSLEMSVKSIKRHFYVLHSNNKDLFGFDTPTISYNDVKHKKLTKEQQEFYIKSMQHFIESSQMGELYVSFPKKSFDLEDFKSLILQHKKQLELKGKSLDLVVLDYITLLTPKNGRRTTVEDINTMIKELRLFCLENGIILWTPIQTNRQGFHKLNTKQNKKSEENNNDIDNLSLVDIGQYSEIEKSFTDIISLNTNPIMSKNGLIKISSILHRESAGLPDDGFYANINPNTGWIHIGNNQEKSEEEIINIIDQLEI